MNETELLPLLVDLGLSSLEAKIYLALAKYKLQPVTAKAVSDTAGVVRQDTYRVLSDLHDYGLVDKILGNPLTFKGIPLQNAVSMLLQHKTRNYYAVKKKSMLALKNCVLEEANIQKNDDVFLVTSNLEGFIKKIEKEIDEANLTIQMIYAKERMAVISFHLLDKIEKAVLRGVKVDLITTSAHSREIENSLRALSKIDILYESLEVRIARKKPDTGLALFDGNRCYIRTAQSLGHSLYSNNSNVAALARFYFSYMWGEAMKPAYSIH